MVGSIFDTSQRKEIPLSKPMTVLGQYMKFGQMFTVRKRKNKTE